MRFKNKIKTPHSIIFASTNGEIVLVCDICKTQKTIQTVSFKGEEKNKDE